MTQPKKMTLLTRHYYSAHSRKTTVHFVAKEFANLGYRVNFLTVGRSHLSTLFKPRHLAIPADLKRGAFTEIDPGIHSMVVPEILHPISSAKGVIAPIFSPYLLRYGGRVPSAVRDAVQGSDIVIIECGYGIAYFPLLKKICPQAKFIYLATDPLTEVGMRSEFEDIERRHLADFDLVRIAAPEFAVRFPPGTRYLVVPQGLKKDVFDRAEQNPYKPGSRNFISVGDMAFDENAVVTMAAARPDIDFHVFGAHLNSALPNIVVHGETPFDKLVPYIKFADAGIMPYKMSDKMTYLVSTSLKFIQYSYCGLPILTPAGPDWGRELVFQYDPDVKESIRAATNAAADAGKNPAFAASILDWSECTARILRETGRAA